MTTKSEESPPVPASKLLVFTDLDGTLLDDDYRWDPAEHSLKLLKSLEFPLILSSSKTLDEMVELAALLNTQAPLICENGGLVAMPRGGRFADLSFGEVVAGKYKVAFNGLRREAIVSTAHDLRSTHSYRFEGFSDWGVDQVCDATGLSREQASLALNRLATEPILWQDTPERWEPFAAALAEHGIGAVRGGRFIHLAGHIDKAKGLERVLHLYRELEPDTQWHLVALGDSPNDAAMLSAADTAVVVPNPRHAEGLAPAAPRIIHAPHPGPTGWDAAMQEILKPYLNPA